MPAEVSPRKLQLSVQRGFDRLSNFRNARMMFIRNYVGQYYDKSQGEIGTEALNLIFNAIRVLVPNIVMSFPHHSVKSNYIAYDDYAELLELALEHHDKQIDIKNVYRQVIVDAIFTLGIMKTGLAASDTIYAIDDYNQIDPGTIYTMPVDFDNFVADPGSKEWLFKDSAYIGDRIEVPRIKLLESGLYNNALVERLPSVDEQAQKKKVRDLSRNRIRSSSADDHLQEQVSVVELWVPDANAVVTVPGDKDVMFDDYLRVDDYYGPKTGPYTILGLTPPVSSNPLPVPMVGVWNDLHVLANRMAKKIITQAERQKDILTYRRAAVDDAQSILNAEDGDTVAVDDVDGAKVLSLGGQQMSNESHLQQLNNWFNMISANPEALAGQRTDASSATEARILASNASVYLEDMKDSVYDAATKEARKRAWFLHTDPFINLPLIQRISIPAQYQQTPMGPMVTQSPQIVKRQVYLTPEARKGEFLDYNFKIEPESMGRKDGQSRFIEAMDFAVKILPAAVQAAQSMMLMGIPFNVKVFILKMAKDRGIDWMDEVFDDPEFQMKMAMMMMRAPGPQGSQGVPMSMMQNGQPGQVMGNPSAAKRERQQQQTGANEDQRMNKATGG